MIVEWAEMGCGGGKGVLRKNEKTFLEVDVCS